MSEVNEQDFYERGELHARKGFPKYDTAGWHRAGYHPAGFDAYVRGYDAALAAMAPAERQKADARVARALRIREGAES